MVLSRSITATETVYRTNTLSARASPAPLADLALDYLGGYGKQVSMVAGTLDVSARPGVTHRSSSRSTLRSLHLALGDRLVYPADGHKPHASPLVVAGIFVPKNINSDFWGIYAGITTYRSLVI